MALLKPWNQLGPEGAGLLVLVQLNHRNKDVFAPSGSTTLDLLGGGVVDSQDVPVGRSVKRPANGLPVTSAQDRVPVTSTWGQAFEYR